MQTMIVAVLLEIVAIPLMGHLSDRIGPPPRLFTRHAAAHAGDFAMV
ncbi:hypothetical protein [Mixta sp. Marseille-Q2659]